MHSFHGFNIEREIIQNFALQDFTKVRGQVIHRTQKADSFDPGLTQQLSLVSRVIRGTVTSISGLTQIFIINPLFGLLIPDFA
jgi:hypothetical protein